MAGLSPAKVACLEAVIALFNQTDNEQFLRLVWPDSPFPNLDPKFLFMLATSDSNKKPCIPSSYYRGFLVYLAELVGKNPSLKLTPQEDDYYYDMEKFNVILQIAFDKAQEVYGGYDLDGGACGGDDYIRGGIESNWILSQVKDAMNSIKAETNRTIESEGEALTQFESLVSELAIQSGKTVPNAFTHVCNQHTSHTRQTLETLRSNCETLSQFVDGSIDIINGTDRRDPDAMEKRHFENGLVAGEWRKAYLASGMISPFGLAEQHIILPFMARCINITLYWKVLAKVSAP